MGAALCCMIDATIYSTTSRSKFKVPIGLGVIATGRFVRDQRADSLGCSSSMDNTARRVLSELGIGKEYRQHIQNLRSRN